MNHVLELGINFWGTANVYGGRDNHGRSEEVIGNWFAARAGRRDRVILATKVYNPMVENPLPNEWQWTIRSPLELLGCVDGGGTYRQGQPLARVFSLPR